MSDIGIKVRTSTRTGPSNPGVTSGRFHIAAITERGPVETHEVVKSIAQFESKYGARTPYSSPGYDTARLFFEEGGSELVVSRVVGPAAVRGSLVLKDRATPTAVNTLRVESIEPGAHAGEITVEVLDVAGNLFTVNVRRNGAMLQGFPNLATPADLVSAAYRSPYVRITNLGSTSGAGAANPAPIAATALTGGSDDRAGITAATVIAALDSSGQIAAGGAVAAPGYPATVIGPGLLKHAQDHRKIALLAMAPGATKEEAAAARATLSIVEGASYGGLFYDAVIVPDGQRSRIITPEGYVAAVRATAHRDVGFWRVPAGDRAIAAWAMDTVTAIDTVANSRLNDAGVNGIVSANGRIKLYGYSSLSEDRDNFALLTARDSLNNLVGATTGVLEPHVFGVIDGRGHFLQVVKSDVVGYLAPLAARGAFYARIVDGQEVDPGYSVTVDESNNTVASLAQNELNVTIAVRLSPTAQLINLEIIKVPLTATV